MEKFAVNYNTLETDLEPKPRVFRYEDVKHRVRKVAFDIVRFTDGDDISGLWEIQSTDDGEVIVAKYDDSDSLSAVEKTAAVHTDWSALSDASGQYVNIFYKDSPVTKLSLASLGIATHDAEFVCGYLPKSLASNKVLSSKLLLELSPEVRQELLGKHPELND